MADAGGRVCPSFRLWWEDTEASGSNVLWFMLDSMWREDWKQGEREGAVTCGHRVMVKWTRCNERARKWGGLGHSLKEDSDAAAGALGTDVEGWAVGWLGIVWQVPRWRRVRQDYVCWAQVTSCP